MNELTLQSSLTLHNGVKIPLLGLGLYQSPPGFKTVDTVKHALEIGYRHIDTAQAYGNEADVGQAVRESGIAREKIFLTTKLWNGDQGYDSAAFAFERSLKALGTDYVDLYLIHFPVEKKRVESWKALEKILSEKRARCIGVSNFTLRHLKELLDHSATVPVINQVELSPFLSQRELIDFCRKRKIEIEAYSPLTRGQKLSDPRLLKIAAKMKKTPAQILLRWAIQQGLIVLPKSNHRARLIENSSLFDFALNPDDMRNIDQWNENFRTCWDPTNIP
jgi:methylglyoxal/glyoxal reductase